MEPLENNALYEKIRTIGRGQRSFVQVARNKATGEQVAIKFIPRGWEPSHTKYVTREILNHQELSLSKHPHVVEFKEVFLTARYLAEVLEYVEGETLQIFLEKVGGKVIEGLARFIFQQLIIALDFCHRKGKVNRDIKLSNILLSIAEGQLPLVKLCDFGFSKDTYRHSEPHSQVGTALFVAPEVMQNFSGGRYDGQAADVWACGVCLFIMLFGRHPYLRPEDAKLNEQQQMIKLFQRMMANEIEFPPELVTSLSPECVDLLSRMLRTDPNQRSTMADIQRHIWFTTALPEGAGLMNDMFLAEDATLLSPQSQSQIEALVSLAAKPEDMAPTRVQLPSHVVARMGASSVPLQQQHPAALAATGVVRSVASSGGLSQGGYSMPIQQALAAGSPTLPSGSAPQVQPSHSQLSNHSSGHATAAGALLHQRASTNTPPQAASPPTYPGAYVDPNSYSGAYTSQYRPDMPPVAQQQQQFYQSPAQQQPNPHMTTNNFLSNDNDTAIMQQLQQQQLQQLQHQQIQQQQQAATAAAVNGVMSMIPDLDAMIMSMPETDLLQAATIDLRPFQQGAASGGSGGGYSSDQQQVSCRQPSFSHPRQYNNSISSIAPGSITGMPGQALQFMNAQNLDPGYSNGNGTQQIVVDAAPFLYEGNDDDLPMIGSVSAVMPKFDWGSFNTPLLANHDTLQASGYFQASRFTRICKDLAGGAKLSETGRPGTPGSHTMSPESLQHQMQAMAMQRAASGGLPMSSMSSQPLSGLSRMMQ